MVDELGRAVSPAPPAADPAGPAPSGEAMKALGQVADIETRLTMVESDSDRIKPLADRVLKLEARFDKAARAVKALAERLEQAEQREADWRRQVERRMEELAALAAPEPPDNWESDEDGDPGAGLPF